MNILTMKRLILICILGLGLLAFAGMHPARVAAAPLRQASCTLPATVTTADELYDCIIAANAGSGGTITLGADINLTALTTSPLPQITTEITLEGAGYAIDGGGIVQIFDVGATAGATGNLTVNQATLQNGSADYGGASFNRGTLTVTNSTLSGNSATVLGGGIINVGTLTVTNSTLSGNFASTGGGILNRGTLTVTNSTFANNSAIFTGGGISNDSGGSGVPYAGYATVTNSTFSGNSAPTGGGIHTQVQLYLAGNLFVAGTSGDNCVNEIGMPNDNGYNLSDDTTCTDGGTGSATNATLNLGSLTDNGGPTLTHLPNDPSDAIGAIPNGTMISNNGTSWTCDQTFADQRGELRPINSGDDCAAGAVEVAGAGRLTIAKETDPAGGTRFPFTIDPGTYSFDFQWGSTGNGDSQFDSPHGVAVDFAGNVYVADTANHRIQKFDSSGAFLTQWGSQGSGDGQFESPNGVAVDATGNVYVADTFNHRIQKFDSSGAFLFMWGWDVVAGNAETGLEVCTPADTCQGGSFGSGNGQLDQPRGVAVDFAGNVYVTSIFNNRIEKFDSSGAFLFSWGWDVVAGNAETGFEVCTPADACQQGSFGSGDGQFNNTTGVAVDTAGNIYVNDLLNSRIQKFDSSGAFLTKWGSFGSGDGQFRLAYGVAVDAAGNVYVADFVNNRIQKFDSSGAFLTQWGSSGSGDGQFNRPNGVAVDAAGNVYVADKDNHRIQVFTPDLSTILDDGESDSFDLAPGDYTISELVPDGWAVAAIDCGDGIVTGQTSTLVTLAAGENITCTFTNTKPTGNLQVTKTVNWNGYPPDNSQTFEICIQGPSYPNGSEPGACQIADYDGATLTWNDLDPGSYTVTETDPGAAWTVAISGSPAAVTADSTAQASVSNTHDPPIDGMYNVFMPVVRGK